MSIQNALNGQEKERPELYEKWSVSSYLKMTGDAIQDWSRRNPNARVSITIEQLEDPAILICEYVADAAATQADQALRGENLKRGKIDDMLQMDELWARAKTMAYQIRMRKQSNWMKPQAKETRIVIKERIGYGMDPSFKEEKGLYKQDDFSPAEQVIRKIWPQDPQEYSAEKFVEDNRLMLLRFHLICLACNFADKPDVHINRHLAQTLKEAHEEEIIDVLLNPPQMGHRQNGQSMAFIPRAGSGCDARAYPRQ